jgi:predicted molibdopterin-dependent oxidoreductase YjgC
VDAKTSGNIIDLCPVGALTNRVSRFRYRPWELKRTKSICTHCSQGCNVRLDARIHQLRRIVARENMGINDEWICDKGRFIHAFVDSPDRLVKPMVRDPQTNALREASWDEALARVVAGLSGAADTFGPNAVGAIGSAKLSNEAAYLLQRLVRSLVGTNNVDHKGGSAVLADPRGLSSIRDVEKADVIVLAGVDLAEEQPVLDLFIRRAARRQGTKLVIFHSRQIEDTRYPGAYVPYLPGQETALFNSLSRLLLRDQKAKERVAKVPGLAELSEWLNPGLASDTLNHPGIAAAVKLMTGAERGLILYGPSVVSGRNAEANRTALKNVALLAGCADRTYYLAPEANSVGVRDVGLLPDRLPGHALLGDTAARERLERLWGGKLPIDPGRSQQRPAQGIMAGCQRPGLRRTCRPGCTGEGRLSGRPRPVPDRVGQAGRRGAPGRELG